MSGICGGSSKAHWNALLTERSKKFYDGTYEWDGVDGYWDEQRVYHRFNDDNDPEGRPPTPRPVSPLRDYAEDDVADSPDTIFDTSTPKSNQSPEFVRDRLVSIDPLFSQAALQHTKDKVIMHFKGKTYQPTILHKDLYAGHVDRERLIGRVEGALVGQWAEQTGLGLRECYKLCGIPDKEAVDAGHAIKGWNKKKVHLRGGEGDEDERRGLSDAVLSECPSDLSEWDVNDKAVKKQGVRPECRPSPKRKDIEDFHNEQQVNNKGKKGIARVVVRDRGSSCDSGIGISTRRRSARHLKTGPTGK